MTGSFTTLIDANIAERWPSDKEQMLVNDYNCANLGLMEGEAEDQAKASYHQFLEERSELKSKIEAAFQ